MLFAVATMDTVAIHDTQQAGPVCLLTKLHYDEFTDMSWSPDGQCLMLSSRDGYCTIVVFDEILPAYHTQQQTLQLQSIAHHHSVPLTNSSSIITPLSTPSSVSVALPTLSPSITPIVPMKRPSDMPLTPATSVDENMQAVVGLPESSSSSSSKRAEPSSADEAAEEAGPPKKKRRAVLTRVGDLGYSPLASDGGSPVMQTLVACMVTNAQVFFSVAFLYGYSRNRAFDSGSYCLIDILNIAEENLLKDVSAARINIKCLQSFAMVDFTIKFRREELISALNYMRVAIPPETKLPDDALHKRLKHALNGSQNAANTIAKPDLDISGLPMWPSGRSVYEAGRRGDLSEGIQIASAKDRAGGDPFPLYSNPFMDLRQTVMGISKHWDEGLKSAIVQDLNREKCGINLRVVDVYKIDDKTPVLLVLYMIATQKDPRPVRWVEEQQRRDGGIPSISATEVELKMLAELLAVNEKTLPSNVKLKKSAEEDGFKASFLLPLGPLTFEDIGKLNKDYGCAVCGAPAEKRCSQCQSVTYCSAECQKADWPQHKKTCRSLKGGTWVTAPFTTQPFAGHPYMAHLNRFNSSRRDKITRAADAPPNNIHEDKSFLIKIQIGGPTMLIYDRQRSFQVHILQKDGPEVFRQLSTEMQGPRGGFMGMKMYRWAKRTGDFELSICLDRAPQETIQW
ncbi:hypothetical protein NM688_g5923 [Phlebia brevispora]|uniref:Uncharacterized protein n=1 Tax=Phlebia brevispora TaxID=194682 RepID=A0ACC1SN08_9APHY|nr:hypothetical protein NM688_g5923 [Phlebia brevispora]